MKKNCKKQINRLQSKKGIKTVDRLFAKWKDYDNSFNS